MGNNLAEAESAILERAVTNENQSWSPEAARAILDFKLAKADLRYADELAAKARQGSITEEEERTLGDHLRVGRIIEFMKARAILSLKSTILWRLKRMDRHLVELVRKRALFR